jgi:thiamine-phosphate pyrophosphorylase
MQLIVITSEILLEDEASILNKLFERGMMVLHLRKPFASESDLRHLLSQINTKYHNRIVLHDCFALAASFQLKGVHLNRRNPIRPRQEVNSLSCSCHSFADLGQSKGLDYVFLSPIFDSISKKGYTQTFTKEDLLLAKATGLINEKVIALGGINTATIPLAALYGFGGMAVLGALWDDYPQSKDENALMKRFDELWTITRKQ